MIRNRLSSAVRPAHRGAAGGAWLGEGRGREGTQLVAGSCPAPRATQGAERLPLL